MSVWTYLGCDIRTGAVIADLPLSGVRFARVLNGHGTLSGNLRLAGYSAGRRRDLIEATDPARRAIYALADGVPQWGGIIWPRADDGGPSQIQAGEWGSYFASVILRRTRTHAGIDQLVIARDLITTHQAESGGNVRVATGTETSAVTRDRTYLPGDALVIGELLDQLGNVENGFDWTWPAEYDSGGLLRGRLLLGYPRLGAAVASIAVEAPRTYGYGEDGATLAVTAWAFGKPPDGGGAVPVATSTDPALLDAGYPLLDKVKTYSTVTDPVTLQAHADADQAAAAGVLTTVTATVGIADVLGQGVTVGDPAMVSLSGPRFPDRFETELRITAIDFDPGADTCALTLAPRITFGGRVPRPEDERERLARVAREVRILSTGT